MCKYLHNSKERITFVSVIKTTKNRRQRISGIKTMTTIYQTVTVDSNDIIIYVGDFYASKDLALKELEEDKQQMGGEDYKGHPWRYCRIETGNQTSFVSAEIKVRISGKAGTILKGIISHKVYEM